MTGQVGILNVGAGDTKLSFDPSNLQERIRAARIVKDMLRRGYALIIEIIGEGGAKTYRRVTDFDESVCEYIIADFDPLAAQAAGRQEDHVSPTLREEPHEEAVEASAPTPPAQGRKPGRRRVKAETVKATAVAPSAGG